MGGSGQGMSSVENSAWHQQALVPGDSFCFLMALSSLATGGGEQKQLVFFPTVFETFPHDTKLVLEPLRPDSEHPHRAVLLLRSYR